jgi:DNA-directed RNA polymerase beta subunit
MDNAAIWNIIDTYFQDNPQALVRHHVDSYNDFFKNGIFRIFKEILNKYRELRSTNELLFSEYPKLR